MSNASTTTWIPPVGRHDPVPSALPSEDHEAQIFWGLRYHIAFTQLKQQFTLSRLRTMLVISLSIFFWCGLFVLFHEGFEFVVDHVGAAGATYHADTIKFVFHLFFASLNVMLVFSSGIILYTGLFNSAETRFLLTLPVRSERIVLYKFQEAVFFSSWGFFLLASPMMIAYGKVVAAPLYYYALLIPLIVSFVYIPSSLGAIACLFIIHKLPRMRVIVVAGAAALVLVVACWSIWQTISGPQTRLFGSDWFQETLHRFRFTQKEWLPSSWLTGGLLYAALPRDKATSSESVFDVPLVQSCLYLALLISNAMLCHVFTIWTAKHWFRQSFSDFACGWKLDPEVRRTTINRAAHSAIDAGERLASTVAKLSDRFASFILSLFPSQVRLLLMKDWKLLRRDPVQWSQFLIFFGLLALYFLNVDRFNNPQRDISRITWINMVSFLNLAVVGLILSTFTTRFIYPMLSLEGHCFWILGLVPMERDTILWSKFWFASLGSWIPCAMLVLLSDLMLQVSGLIVGVHQLTCVLLCLGLASIAVGLGAIMPNFQETSPSKIAAGFGGTLNLVLSALYIILIVVLTALPCHFYLIAGNAPWRESFLNPTFLKLWLYGGTTTSIVLGIIATVVPLRWGLLAFRKLEFS